MTIIVQNPVSAELTEVKTQDGRLEIIENGQARKVKDLRGAKSQGQRAVDPAALMQMMLDGKDIPAPEDVDTQLTAEMLKWQTVADARQSLKPKIAAAKFKASTAVFEVDPGNRTKR